MPNEIIQSKLSLVEAKQWIFYETDVKDYYNYFPLYISYPEHQIRVYYVNINKNSEYNGYVSCLLLLGGQIPSNRFEY